MVAATREVPAGDGSGDLPPVHYDRGYQDFYTYEVIPDDLIPTAKRLRVKWPSFSDYLIPDHVRGWQSFRDASLALRSAEPDVSRTVSDNQGDPMDSFSYFWKSKLNKDMTSMATAGYSIQTALVAVALPILNYKKYALDLMNHFHGQEKSFWSFFNGGPSDADYEASAADLEQKYGQVRTAVQQSVTQINSAHDLLQTADSDLDGDIERFEANGVSTATITR
ncbi:hypothetical protein [Actinomadura sp. DC4]|uniref:hypothetical protein n=1 Tax=Actinomadura sp. DC4 TaxID=3055069 RepID=UPI0025B13F10|nr:hypothetical protein [Actinomadura sp. DC4]MDN3357259.1 hypothetical protein [Actinomadura sp. DC4]